jgi:hypothetical protein
VVFYPSVSCPDHAFIIAVFLFFGKLSKWFKGEADARTLSLSGVYPDITTMGIDYCLADIQAKAGAAYVALIAMVAMELFKQSWHNTGWDTNTEVFYYCFN